MYKLAIFMLFAVLAVATAQYLTPSLYNGVYRSGYYGGGLYSPTAYSSYVSPTVHGYGYPGRLVYG